MEFGIPSRYKGIRLPPDSGPIIQAVPLQCNVFIGTQFAIYQNFNRARSVSHIQFNDCVLHITTVSTSYMNYNILLLTWTLWIRYINSKGHIPLPEPMELFNINFFDEAKMVSIRNMTDMVDVRAIPWSTAPYFW